MNRLIYTFLLAAFTGIFGAAAQVTGKWKTFDDKTGEAKSIVQIYEQDGKIYGKVIEILNPAKKNNKCTDCKGADKDKPILGIVVIKGLTKDGNEYTDGDILDPNNGKLYSCTVKLKEKDKLDVRGYLGISMLGRTQTWTRVE